MNTTIDQNSSRNQDIKSRLVNREVYYCVSALVSEMSQKAEHFPDYEDDLFNAYQGLPDYEEAAQAEGWRRAPDGGDPLFFKTPDKPQYFLSVNLQERGQVVVSVHRQDLPGQGVDGPAVWEFNGTEDDALNLDGSECFNTADADGLLTYLQATNFLPEDAELSTDAECNFETSDADGWQELCESERIDTDDYCSDIYEHWLVSDWLANRLEENGQRVLRDFFGLTVWCRPTSGQAIAMDGVIGEIAADMEILEGQRNEWTA